MPVPLPDSLTTAAGEDEQFRFAELDRLLESAPSEPLRLVTHSGHEVQLPASAVPLLHELVHQLARGRAVRLVPMEKLLTTQQAAEFLGISRPYLVRLLKRGEIPYTTVGSHHRVRLEDVLAYRRLRTTAREASLRELTRL